jgi:hypothetical protein
MKRLDGGGRNFVVNKMGSFKDATREVGASERFKKNVGSFYDYCFGRF